MTMAVLLLRRHQRQWSMVGLLLSMFLVQVTGFVRLCKYSVQFGLRQGASTTSSSSPLAVQRVSSAAVTTTTSLSVWTQMEFEEYAAQQGVSMSVTTLGPGFRAVARSTQNETQILGYGEGFIRPTGNLLHLDKMEVFGPMLKLVRKDNPDFKGGGTMLGIGLFLGYACLLHGKENKCKQAEFLAIDDSPTQHKRLVRYYKNSGFDVIKYVGEGLQDVPARLVWGGCGTLFRKDVDALLSFWSGLMERSKEKATTKL